MTQRTKSKPHRVTCKPGNRISISCDEHRVPLLAITTGQPIVLKKPKEKLLQEKREEYEREHANEEDEPKRDECTLVTHKGLSDVTISAHYCSDPKGSLSGDFPHSLMDEEMFQRQFFRV